MQYFLTPTGWVFPDGALCLQFPRSVRSFLSPTPVVGLHCCNIFAFFLFWFLLALSEYGWIFHILFSDLFVCLPSKLRAIICVPDSLGPGELKGWALKTTRCLSLSIDYWSPCARVHPVHGMYAGYTCCLQMAPQFKVVMWAFVPIKSISPCVLLPFHPPLPAA